MQGQKLVQEDKRKSSQVPDMFTKEFPTALHLRLGDQTMGEPNPSI
jgi:hypothetical protein